MSSALTVIVLGHAFFNTVPNTSPVQQNFTAVLSSTQAPSSTEATSSTEILNTSELPFLTTPAPDRPKRPDYTYTPGVGAHKLITNQSDWNTARRTCEEDGGHLVIINSVAEAEVVVRLLNSANLLSSHVGLHDLYQEGEFVTILDEALERVGFNVWREGEPNNQHAGENCVAIFTSDDKLNDIPCGHSTSFVCELPYVQPPQDLQHLESSLAPELGAPDIA